MCLAVLSVFGGWINVPEELQHSLFALGGALPMSEWLHHWLEPVTATAYETLVANQGPAPHEAPFGGGEVMWAAISTVLAGIVVLVSSRMVGSAKVEPAPDSAEPQGIQKLLYNKWYVDEIYDALIVRPILRASRFAWRVIDQGIIDGVVNAVGLVAKSGGYAITMFQTGSINTYAFFIAVGVLAALGIMVF